MGRFETITTSDDYLDSRQIEDRIEELQDMGGKYAVGLNMPGFMPDSEPYLSPDWDSACEALAKEMRRTIESLGEHEAETAQALEEIADKLEAGEFDEKDGFAQTIGAYHYWIASAENEGLDSDDFEELKTWRALKAECECYGWDDGIQFIAESKFEDYAEEFADDIGAIDKNASWPLNCIDWEKAARELKQDFSEVEIDGKTYYYREA